MMTTIPAERIYPISPAWCSRIAPNARFWVYWNDTYTKLTLKPGQMVQFQRGGPTDEGWSSEGEWYAYQDDGVIVNETFTDGRDCDGRLTTWARYRTSLADLKAHHHDCLPPYVPGMPIWEKHDGGQRDYSAEAMGY